MSQLPLELNTTLTLQQQGQHEIAEQLCRQFLSREPGHAEGCYILGTLLLHQQRGEEALVEFQKALQHAPVNGDYWLGVTEALLQLNRPRDAFQTIDDLINKGLDWPAAMTLRERAREALEQALVENSRELDRSYIYPRTALGHAKIFLINSIKNYGATGVDYLKPLVNSFRKTDFDYCVINIPDHCGIDSSDVEEILGVPVLSMKMNEIPNLDCDVVISNDAYLGRLLDDSIEAIFIFHGAAPMPVSDPFYFSGWIAYWDGLIMPSKTSIKLCCAGLNLYRQFRKNLKLPTPQDALRSDLRLTNIYQTRPLKIQELFSLPGPNLSDSVTVGLLPSAMSTAGNNTMYRYLTEVLSSILYVLPNARIIIRPYPMDLHNKQLTDFLLNLSASTSFILIDNSCSSSSDFYSQCHLIITDVSTGGVTFMLRRGCPAIYYLPALGNSSVERQWFNEMQNYLLVATSPETLRIQINKATKIFGDPMRSLAKNFAQREFMMENAIDQFVGGFVSSDTRQSQSKFRPFAVKRITSSGRVIDMNGRADCWGQVNQ